MPSTITETSEPSSFMIRVLIVEDEYVIAANLSENLMSSGYNVVGIASSATEAIEAAAQLRPDVVLMDIRLQGEMDGIQAAEIIWNGFQIPVIYISGHSDRSTLDRAKMTFPFGYLLKPVKGNELYVAIETALSRYEREQLLANVLKSIGDGLIVVDTYGRVIYLNKSAELMTGWQQHAARNQDLTNVFNVISEVTHLPLGNLAMIAIQQDTIIFPNERILLMDKDGTSFPITNSVAPVKNRIGLITGAVLIFRDDSQRRLKEERDQAQQQAKLLQGQNEGLEKLVQLKDDFLSAVSHELRTPLTNIKVAIRMLELTLSQLETADPSDSTKFDRLTQYISIVRDQCTQEISLVDELLELQHYEAGARPIDPVAIDLNQWLIQEIAVFEERAQSCEQEFQVQVQPNLPTLVSDQKVLTRIIAELLTNACKYTPPGGRIAIAVQPQMDDSIRLVVTNTGVEIPTDQLSRIFDKFYRIPNSDRWKQGGTGLGLALVKKQITHLGGRIWVESNPEQTAFTIELPLSSADTHL